VEPVAEIVEPFTVQA
jgi:hypothetical protein